MKKAVFFALVSIFSVAPSIARAFIADAQVVQEKSGTIHLSTTVAANISPAVFDLIKLASGTSTTSNVLFPHRDLTGELDISEIRVNIDKAAASTCTVRIGVVNFVNQSTGSATFFWNNNNGLNVSNTASLDTVNHVHAFTRCRIISSTTFNNDGFTPYIASNEKRSGSTLYSGAALLFSPLGSGVTLAGVGDIVAEIITGAASVNVTFDLIYHSEP